MLYCMNPTWTSAIIDVEGAFLQGQFANGEELYIEVPDGFHKWYQGDAVLCLNVPNPDDCRSISGCRVFVSNTPICFRSITQKFVTWSMTEAEIATGTMVAQDMLYVYRLLESL